VTSIPRWSSVMSVKDPLLDAQHIELLEMCRSIQQDLDRGHGQNWTLEQKLHEFAFLLEEHEEIEARVFGSRGQNLTQEQSNQRAAALRDVQALADNFERKKYDPIAARQKVAHWIQLHF